MALAVFGGGGYTAVGGAYFGARRRRLLRLRAQILSDLVALDLVVERSEVLQLADFFAVARDRQGVGTDRRGRVDLRHVCLLGLDTYAARGGSARSDDEWIFGGWRWIRRRRRRPFSEELDLALAEVAVYAGRFWEDGDSAQWEATDFGRGIICCWPILGLEIAAGPFWWN